MFRLRAERLELSHFVNPHQSTYTPHRPLIHLVHFISLRPWLTVHGVDMVAHERAQLPEAQSLRILCIDGGGIKGYTALLILRRIFRTLSADISGNPSPRACDLFDLIAGTSTGGIIAVMLGRLHMTIDECIEVYERLGKDVFGRPVGGQVGRVLRGMTGSPFYDIADLQESIRSVLKAKGIGPDEPFIEKEGPRCKVYVLIRIHPESNLRHRRAVMARQTNRQQNLVCNPG